MEQGDTALAMLDNININDEDVEDEDDEDDAIRPTDSLLVVAMTEDEMSHLEVQLFSEDGGLFVHHDITLPDFPLSLAWMDCPPFLAEEGQQQAVGSYIAVGTFSPAIEIWNLDVLDPLEPSAVLGGEISSAKKKKQKFIKGSHEAAVMTLSWNNTFRQVLASGSADTTVKIWDVTTQQCSHTLRHHSDKVQSVQWHPSQASLLASGSFDRTVKVIDCRATDTSEPVLSISVPSDIECVCFDPHSGDLFLSMESGEIGCCDLRNASSLQIIQAHKKTVSSISFSSLIPGMMATASVDKTIKIWDTIDRSNPFQPVAYKSMNVGKLFCLNFSQDQPFLLAAAGDKGVVAVWESDEMEVIREHFSDRQLPPKETYASLNHDRMNILTSNSNNTIDNDNNIDRIDGQINEQVNSTEVDNTDWIDDNTGIATNQISPKKKKNKKNKKI